MALRWGKQEFLGASRVARLRNPRCRARTKYQTQSAINAYKIFFRSDSISYPAQVNRPTPLTSAGTFCAPVAANSIRLNCARVSRSSCESYCLNRPTPLTSAGTFCVLVAANSIRLNCARVLCSSCEFYCLNRPTPLTSVGTFRVLVAANSIAQTLKKISTLHYNYAIPRNGTNYV